MDVNQISLMWATIIIGYYFYSYLEKNGKEKLFLLFPIGIALYKTIENYLFKYRLNIMDWNLGEKLGIMFFNFIIMAAFLMIPCVLIIFMPKLNGKKAKV